MALENSHFHVHRKKESFFSVLLHKKYKIQNIIKEVEIGHEKT